MSRRSERNLIFYAAIAVVVYFLISVCIAIATANDCGNLNATKHWAVVPPKWECGR